MSRRALLIGAAVVVAAALAWALIQGRQSDPPDAPDVVMSEEGAVLAEPPGSREEDVHRDVFETKMAWAREEGLDTLPMGEIMARLGVTFVGTTYTPGTLDPPGPEGLVVNLNELDCVTFLESVLAMARLLRQGSHDFADFERELERIRYREGRLQGYPSRLHYFSEWIADNDRKGLVRDITRELGGVPAPEPINFMTRNRESYRQLEDPEVFAAIRRMEERLSGVERYYIPQDRIAQAAPGIQNGDIIAATSSLPGLDVAHTGMALWQDGELHLLHAPLVGKWVEISEVPLAQRIRGIQAQDGIMVARPR